MGEGAVGVVGAVGAEPQTIPTSETEAARIRDRRDRHRPNTKIVCRRLPPSMTEELFLEQVSPVPEHDYFYFSKPDPSLAPNLFCRAYINFVNVEDIFIFRDKFDDYIFLDDKGNEYPAIVEYAPFQRIIKKRRKKDIKCGTLENDPVYLEFLDSLKETDSDSREPKMEYSYQPTEEKKETVTPLLEYLAARKRDDKRRREEKQRRRPRVRMSKDDEYDDNKQANYKDDGDEIDDDASPINDEPVVEIKDVQYQGKGRSRSYKEQRRSNEEHHKRSDYNKRDRGPTKDSSENNANEDEKLNHKDRRNRQRETYREKYKDQKSYDVKKEKYKSDRKPNKISIYKELSEKDQEKSAATNTKSGTSSNVVDKNAEKGHNVSKGPPISSKIKPFTQLPQYKPSDLPKVIDEMDANRQKSESKVENDSSSTTQATKTSLKDADKKSTVNSSTKQTKILIKNKDDKDKNDPSNKTGKDSPTKEVKSTPSENSPQQRRKSLESKQNHSEDVTLRRNKSLEEKSEDGNDKNTNEKSKENDPRTERRIRNKDRPSLVIYQPGMGKFSKQRIGKEKDGSGKTSEGGGKIEHSSNSSSNSVNSQDLVAEE